MKRMFLKRIRSLFYSAIKYHNGKIKIKMPNKTVLNKLRKGTIIQLIRDIRDKNEEHVLYIIIEDITDVNNIECAKISSLIDFYYISFNELLWSFEHCYYYLFDYKSEQLVKVKVKENIF